MLGNSVFAVDEVGISTTSNRLQLRVFHSTKLEEPDGDEASDDAPMVLVSIALHNACNALFCKSVH